MTRKVLIGFALQWLSQEIVLGAGLEPASLSAYAPQTYVSAIPPPELREGANFPQTATAGKCRLYSSYSCSSSPESRRRISGSYGSYETAMIHD
jgi:hypothetical protein